MNESKRVILRVAAIVCFVLGLLLFLFETQSSGEAPERFGVTVSIGPAAIGGAAAMILAVATLVILYLWEWRKHLKHS